VRLRMHMHGLVIEICLSVRQTRAFW